MAQSWPILRRQGDEESRSKGGEGDVLYYVRSWLQRNVTLTDWAEAGTAGTPANDSSVHRRMLSLTELRKQWRTGRKWCRCELFAIYSVSIKRTACTKKKYDNIKFRCTPNAAGDDLWHHQWETLKGHCAMLETESTCCEMVPGGSLKFRQKVMWQEPNNILYHDTSACVFFNLMWRRVTQFMRLL